MQYFMCMLICLERVSTAAFYQLSKMTHDLKKSIRNSYSCVMLGLGPGAGGGLGMSSGFAGQHLPSAGDTEGQTVASRLLAEADHVSPCPMFPTPKDINTCVNLNLGVSPFWILESNEQWKGGEWQTQREAIRDSEAKETGRLPRNRRGIAVWVLEGRTGISR